jgi:AcrR family transcriptional regulator
MTAMTPTTHPGSLKERQRHERECLILQAAGDLLVVRGYHDMSIDDIAAQVGISKGTVYLHFASNEDLAIALLERGVRSFHCALEETLSTDVAPREKLQTIIEQVYSDVSGRHFQLIHIIFQDPALLGRMVEARRALGERWGEPSQRIAAVLEEGKARGDFDPTMPTPVMVSLFWSLLSPHTYRSLVEREGIPPEAVARHISRFFFQGIAPSGASGRPPEDAQGTSVAPIELGGEPRDKAYTDYRPVAPTTPEHETMIGHLGGRPVDTPTGPGAR